jgi:N-acetyldiaminopimelate deacetylase
MSDLSYLYEIRKRLHRTPEIAFNEFKTQEIIINEFKDYKPLKITKFDPTGLLYEYSNGSGEYILFRADMDALPILEKTDCDFQSENIGMMHACGHDIHITILIGLIHHVLKNDLKMNLLFLFQPAEEGHGGAEHILKTGIFNNYKIKSAYALHVTGQFPTGTVGVKSGIIFGIPQEFDIEFFGKAGHVASPHKGKDAFLAALSFYNEINTVLSKKFPAQEPVIFHVGKITAGTVRNIIPDYCKFEGTTRTIKKEVKEQLNALLFKIAEQIEKTHEVSVKVNLLTSYDPVINDEDLTNRFIDNLPSNVNVVQVDYSMTGEDFGFFSGLYPSVLFWLGSDTNDDLHSNRFLPDEKSIDVGLSIYINILKSKLEA